MFWKYQPFEPIEQVVRQHADHQTAHVYGYGMAAHAGKIKTVFGFLDKVLHTAAVVVEPDDIFRCKVYVCYDECIHVSHLIGIPFKKFIQQRLKKQMCFTVAVILSPCGAVL